MKPSNSKQGYMPQLDSLRALAVFAVLLSHFGLGSSVAPLLSPLSLGRFGVDLFFVLSGFLITGLLLDARTGTENGVERRPTVILRFFFSRALRIFPAFYLTLGILYIIDFHGFSSVALEHALYLSNFDFVRYASSAGGWALQHPSTAHFWSLAAEEQFYLVWPMAVLFLVRGRLLPLLIALVVLSLLWRAYWLFLGAPAYPHWGMLMLPSCMGALAMGGLLAMHLRGELPTTMTSKRLHQVMLLGGVATVAGCLALNFLGWGHRVYELFFDLGAGVVSFFMILRAAQSRSDAVGRFLSSPTLRYLGKISYGIYLYHAFAPHLVNWLLSLAGLEKASLPVGLWLSTVYIVSILLAVISWHLLEVQILKLKRSRAHFNLSLPLKARMPRWHRL